MPPRRSKKAVQFAPCVSPFISALQRRTLPTPVADDLRAAGLPLRGSIAAGFSPGAFHFPDPNPVGFGVIVSDATWGKRARLRVCFLDRSPLGKKVEKYANYWSDFA